MKILKAFFKKHKAYVRLVIQAVFLTALIELLSRKSPLGLCRFIFLSPLVFTCNMLIILITLLISRLFQKRCRFVAAVISLIWVLFGVVNAVVLKYRMTPFSGEDFNMVTSLVRIAKNYLSFGMIVMIIAALVLFIGVIVLLWFKMPLRKRKRNLKEWVVTIVFILGTSLLLWGSVNVSLKTNQLSRNFMNLADAYEKYGFAYCFTNSLLDKGIGRPDKYSRKMMKQIAEGIQISREVGVQQAAFLTGEGGAAKKQRSEYKSPSDVKPNIIMIQLESFFDPSYMKGYHFSEDPIPNFHAIQALYASGILKVPVVGAGTANTEFEVLTGMSTDYFGAGEYPYNTVLQDRTVESVANVLKGEGYYSSVIHNNTGTFYHRDTVFSQMGFDAFVPAEYMYDLETTPNNWAKDKVLTGVIMDIMQKSNEKDFVYAITVQSHGRYPEDEVLENPEITVSCSQESVNLNAVTYYVNEIHEVDEMIGELTEELKSFDEPVVLVMFGDHLPALGFTQEDVKLSSVYQTEYVVWNNFGLHLEDQDLQAESLSTAVLSTFDLASGIIPQFHESYDGTAVYDRYLHLLEYDMLYGEGHIFRYFADDIGLDKDKLAESAAQGTIQAYEPSEMEIGYKTISIDSWEIKAGHLFVHGENFTESSRIVVDGSPADTIFVDEGLLIMEGAAPKAFKEVYVGQFDENLVQLGEGTNVLEGEEAQTGEAVS